jgi:hypothetical protein
MIILNGIHEVQVLQYVNSSEMSAETVKTNESMCIQTFPCGAMVSHKQHMITLPTCIQDPDNQTLDDTTYILNLPILTPLMSEKTREQFSAEELYLSELEIQLPELPNKTLKENLALKKAYATLGMDTIQLIQDMNQSLATGKLFWNNLSHPEDPWITLANDAKSGWTDFTNWLTDPFGLIGKVITVAHILLTAYLTYRIHTIFATMFTLQMQQASAAIVLAKIPAHEVHNRFVMTLDTMSNATDTSIDDKIQLVPFDIYSHSPQLSNEYHVPDLLVWLTLLTLLFYVMAKMAQKRCTPTLQKSF